MSNVIRNLGWHKLRFERDDRKVAVSCVTCGRGMWLPASKSTMYRTCGGECSKAAYNAIKEARRRDCLICGKSFVPRQRQLDMGQGKYCSQKCNPAKIAMNSPQAQAKSKETWKKRFAVGLIKPRIGPDNPKWRGGPKEALRRAIEDGRSAKRVKKYRAANPHKVREFANRRNHRKYGRLPRGTVLKIGEAQKWKCVACKCNIQHKYHVDHITPLAKGGVHAPSNIQLLCPSCNVRKGAKDPIAFMQSRGYLL